MSTTPRIALVHEFLINIRGGERVLLLLADMFPGADIFTLLYDPSQYSEAFRRRNVQASFVQALPLSKRHFQLYTPLYQHAIEAFNLAGYDLVISSSWGWAHGVLAPPTALHLCYYHTPFRYAWHWYGQFIQGQRGVRRLLAARFLKQMRLWDFAAAQRVDWPIANSVNVSRRLQRYYSRPAKAVIPPPIHMDGFVIVPRTEDFFLVVSALVPHKRVDVAIAAFTHLGLPLVVVGVGSDEGRLRRLAGPSVRFAGHLEDTEVRALMSRCRALIFTAEDDFGIVPLEAQASGRPVIAYGRGGALETIQPGLTGTFYMEQSPDSLIAALEAFSPTDFDPLVIRRHAAQFDEANFRLKFHRAVDAAFAESAQSSTSKETSTP